MMRAAIFQCDLAGAGPEQRLRRLGRVAAESEADLLLCPELFMSGYAIGDEIPRFAESANGGFAQGVARIAKSTGTAIAYGFPEAAEGLIFNAAQCIDASGATVARHRKTMLPPGFEAGCFTPGRGLTLFTLGGLTIGLLICYEAEFPEAVRACALAGAGAVLVPTALGKAWPVVAHRVVPARAFENGIHVLYANHAGYEGGIDYLGASCIVGPDGNDIARASDGDEVILASLDPARVRVAQERLPYLADRAELAERLVKIG